MKWYAGPGAAYPAGTFQHGAYPDGKIPYAAYANGKFDHGAYPDGRIQGKAVPDDWFAGDVDAALAFYDWLGEDGAPILDEDGTVMSVE